MRYFVGIGGGAAGITLKRLLRKHVPEYAEWNDTMKMLKSTNPHKSILHFGGETCTQVRTFTGIFTKVLFQLARQWTKTKTDCLPNYIQLKLGKRIRRHATTTIQPNRLQDITETFSSIEKQCTENDELIVFLSSHGNRRGVLQWNEYFRFNYLSAETLKQLLNKIDPKCQITIIVDACYSGTFLSLTDSRTIVYTSSNHYLPSYYTCFGNGWVSQIPWLEKQTRIATITNSTHGGNFQLSHSLNWWLDRELYALAEYSPSKTYLIQVAEWIQTTRHRPLVHYSEYAVLIALIFLDSSGAVATAVNAKLLFTLWKSFILIVKCFAVVKLFSWHVKRGLLVYAPAILQKWNQRLIWRDLSMMKRVANKYPVNIAHTPVECFDKDKAAALLFTTTDTVRSLKWTGNAIADVQSKNSLTLLKLQLYLRTRPPQQKLNELSQIIQRI
jgi:hypothetical protein